MLEIFSQNQILVFGLIGFFLLLFLILFFVSRKETPQSKIFHDTLFLEVSDSFKKEAEAALKSEIETAAKELREALKASSFELISNYQREIEKLTREISLLSPEFKSTLTKKLDSAIINLFENIKKSLLEIEKMNRQTSRLLLGASKQKIEALEKEIREIFQALKINLVKKQTEIENSLENYKNERLKEIEEEIFQILNEVAIKILGKAIDLSTHEELVIKSLEKAKKEKLF